MNKQVSSGKAAMDKILEGINLVADPVKSTLGAMGRTVIISQSFIEDYGTKNYPVVVTKDGWRVSQSINSSDPLVQAGVLFVQEAAQKQMNDAGDATTTCCLLTQAIVTEGLKAIQAGANPHDLKRGIEVAVEYVVTELKKMAIPINGDIERIRQVATISANNDSVIGDLIAEAYSKIGVEGSVTIEEAKGIGTSIKIADGFKFHRGWASPYFITNPAKEECVLEEPCILIYDRPISQLQPLMPLLEKILKASKPLLIICEDSDGEALATLTFNVAKGSMKACVINLAFMGDNKIKVMEDIATVTGGTFINELKGVKLENVTLAMLGQAKKIIIGKENTVIIGGVKDEKEYAKTVDSLKKLLGETEGQEEKEKIEKRIARLNEGVAILSIGAMTEVEMKEKKDRADDAVRATKCAIEEGFVAGGGSALFKIILLEKFQVKFDEGKKNGEVVQPSIGFLMMSKILQEPFKQICLNAGVEYENVTSGIHEFGNGYNVKTGKVENLIESGIIDAAKSNRCALQNAASVACAILTSQYIITDTI